MAVKATTCDTKGTLFAVLSADLERLALDPAGPIAPASLHSVVDTSGDGSVIRRHTFRLSRYEIRVDLSWSILGPDLVRLDSAFRRSSLLSRVAGIRRGVAIAPDTASLRWSACAAEEARRGADEDGHAAVYFTTGKSRADDPDIMTKFLDFTKESLTCQLPADVCIAAGWTPKPPDIAPGDEAAE
jgi:hypothetical protein